MNFLLATVYANFYGLYVRVLKGLAIGFRRCFKYKQEFGRGCLQLSIVLGNKVKMKHLISMEYILLYARFW